MRQLKRICVGTNFSAESEIAIESAVRLAATAGAVIDLVNVVEPISVYQRVLTPIQSRIASSEDRKTRARERLENLAGQWRSHGVTIDCEVRIGSPSSEIIAAVRDHDDDLIMVGGRTGSSVQSLILGRTAERVLRKAPVPVLVTKSVLAARPQTILAPTDFSEASIVAMVEAIALARRWHAKLLFLHVIEPITEAYVWPMEPGPVHLYLAEPAELEPEWQSFLASLDLEGLRWEKDTVQGYASPMINSTAAKAEADLIVMGTHGRTGLAHALLGSVAEQVVQQAACPVLTVRPEAHEFVLP